MIYLQGKVQGLLGNFNGNATDDLRNVNYTVAAQIDNNSLDDLTLYQLFKYPCKYQIQVFLLRQQHQNCDIDVTQHSQ